LRLRLNGVSVKMKKIYLILFFLLALNDVKAQSLNDTVLWRGKERELHYRPSGTDFVCINGKRRFVRALYGTNTAFRVETGDLPEFALYMPGMGGNFKFGIIAGNRSKWLIDAQHIRTIYRPGSMLYEIKDPILGDGTMYITVLALADAEGMVIKTGFKNINKKIELVWLFGGASGKKFSRDGDIGADPESSFYLQAENCRDNVFQIDHNSFQLSYGTGKVLSEEERYEIQQVPKEKSSTTDNKSLKQLTGLFPPGSVLKLADASKQLTPAGLFNSTTFSAPVITGKIKIENTESWFLIQNAALDVTTDYNQLKIYFNNAEAARKKIADRVKVNTPDQYINTIGGALSIAADAIWEDPSYLHGAVAWRMRLNAWRGAYAADPLGWHDRARKHFSSYALSQVTTPAITGVVMDTALHLARHLEKIGTALFSDGCICRNPGGDIRAHHYDMNLVFVDQLLNHFNWTGDTGYVREMWPLIKRHLAWEKRNFDADGDGLYDAYAAIWASDALQYSGGGVTHSSAYNYRANKTAAELAKLIGEDGAAYKNEADKIYNAIQKNLWLPEQGSYAEYKDLLGKQLVHPSPGLWTIYHAIDSKLPDAFQAYQNLSYIDDHVPHIPVTAKEFNKKGLYLLSTTNWQPYTWSINNVALAENLHTALAYWQGGRNDAAYDLWRSAIIESMYMSASPGGFEQLSMAGRSLVEGLFGIQPDALHDTLAIQPGFPWSWNYASLSTPDISFDFKRNSGVDNYVVRQSFPKTLSLKLIVEARRDEIAKITVNGKAVNWTLIPGSIDKPMLQISAAAGADYKIAITYKGKTFSYLDYDVLVYGDLKIKSNGLKLLSVYDPKKTTIMVRLKPNELTAELPLFSDGGEFFVQVKQGAFSWWEPVSFVKIRYPRMYLPPDPSYSEISKKLEKVSLDNYFNDKVTNIFKQQYLSPRPQSPTLQLPTQGIGNWCYPLTIANIDDRGTREKAGAANEIISSKGVPFRTPSDSLLKNILFTSQWDNYPDSITVALSGSASYVYLLMAGTTNPMQSQLINAMITVRYTDGTSDELGLYNPDSWWPIEQDYFTQEKAFEIRGIIPDRLYLKEGKFAKAGSYKYSSIKGFTNRAIDGGAATVLEMRLDKDKTLQSLIIQAIANDVVIGLMAATLLR
jgi:hypothetical protein